MTTWPLIEDWLSYLAAERRYSSRTVEAYGRDVAAFAAYSPAGVDEIAEAQIRAWLATQHRRGASPRTLQRRLASLRSYFRYLIRRGRVGANPAASVRAPKQAKLLPRALDVDEVNGFLDAMPRNGALACRDRAMLELFYSSGLRLAELRVLDLGDLPARDASLRVRGKGGKERDVPVGRKARRALADWLPWREQLAPAGEPALFVARSGVRLGMRSIQQRLAVWAQRLGLPQHLHPHMLRHSFASHMLQSSGDLRAVQELLGHANIATTQIYTRLDFQHLAAVYDAAHPRARRKT